MSISIADAYLHAKSVSLHNTDGASDKLYDIQLVPVETPDGIRWSVFAQNGRRGSTMTHRIKHDKVDLSTASKTYGKLQTEKIRGGYVVVQSGRESDLSAKILEAKLSLTEKLPTWAGFDALYLEVVNWAESRAPASTRPTMNALVALTDIAYNAAEGLPDAIAQVRGAPGVSGVVQLMSPDILSWLPFGASAETAEQLSNFCSQL
jgi:hypothetical protein